nr:hypothetical protein [Streptomyces sp. ISL-100]
MEDMLALAHLGRISRRGQVGEYEYVVHGVGCRLVGPDGAEVDVDFVDGTEAFDFWRLRRYGESLSPPTAPPPEELLAAISSLTPLITEVRPGWFAVSGRSVATVIQG